MTVVMRLPTGCRSLDDLLGGGIEVGAITEFYGEAGSGKTNICLQLARNICLMGKKCVFIDTEGVSMERLAQICGEDTETVLKNLLFFRPYSLEEQDRGVEDALRLTESEARIGLVVLDSATVYYRVTFGTEDEADGRKSISNQMGKLMRIARKKDIPVVITTQVYTAHGKSSFEPIGGHILFHNAKAIVLLEKVETGVRRAVLKKHRSRPEGLTVEFSLTACGLG